MSTYDSGSLAWVLSASIGIMLMAPGVGLFYAGTVNKKNLLSIIAFSFLIFSSSTITWGLVGFSLAYGNQTLAKGFIGDCIYCGFRYISDTSTNQFSSTISFPSFFFLEMMYAGVAGVVAIIPFVGRLRTIFIVLITAAYQLIIYSPITYWIRSTSGWLNKLGAIDFSGGTMVHLTAGFSTVAIFYMIGKGKNQMHHQNSASTFSTLIGTALIWFSSFGFNGAASFTSGSPSAVALINTQLAAAGGVFGWAFTQYIFTDRTKVIGWCCGAVCGVISITPCAGYVALWASVVIGAFASIIVYIFCHFNSQPNQIPDMPSVFKCHGISSFWGVICAGAFSTLQSGSKYQGLFYGGESGGRLFGVNLLCAIVSGIYSFVVMVFIYFIMLRLVEPSLTQQQQQQGLDLYSYVEQKDPLDEQDIFTIMKTLNSYTDISKIMEENVQDAFTPRSNVEKIKIKNQIKKRKKQPPMPSQEILMEKIHEMDRVKQAEMIKKYEEKIKSQKKIEVK